MDDHLDLEDREIVPRFGELFTAAEYEALTKAAIKQTGLGKQAAFTVPYIGYWATEPRSATLLLAAAPLPFRILYRTRPAAATASSPRWRSGAATAHWPRRVQPRRRGDRGQAGERRRALGLAHLVAVVAVGHERERQAGGRIGPRDLAAGAVVPERPRRHRAPKPADVRRTRRRRRGSARASGWPACRPGRAAGCARSS